MLYLNKIKQYLAMKQRFKILIACGVLLPALAGFAAWRGADESGGAVNGRWHKPQRRTIDQPLLLRGTLLPVAAVNIVAPVDGRLVERPVEFGDRVEAGQLLARIDSPELASQLRDAEVAAIRADQDLAAAQQLEQGAEYQAAQRRAVLAETALNTAQHRTAESQTLYDKGIIARTELEAMQQEVSNAQSQVQSARDEVAALLKKRSTQALRILQLEAQGRRQKQAELRLKEQALRVVAPMAGIVLSPIPGEGGDTGSGGAKEIKPGSSVTSRDVILSVGDTTAFVVKSWVDEQDLRRLELNQSAAVMLSSDPSNELSGKVLRISSQARPADQRGAASPEFEVQVLVLAPPDVTLRVGAAAQVRLELKPMAGGLLVPLTALRWRDDGKPLLKVRTDGGGDALLPVETGRTTADSVEVRSGIAEADEVWVPGPGAAGSQKSGLLQRLFNTGDE
jgi:HlyD family secretion protein